MQGFLWVGLGGGLGAISRYGLSTWIANRWGTTFPLGTFVINVSGCLILGFFGTLALSRAVAIPPEWRLLIAVGFVGAYTTFSTYGFETLRLIQSGSLLLALANVLGSNILGLLAVYAGMAAARALG